MKRLTLTAAIVNAENALLGGVISDRSPAGTLIAGYMIRLIGTTTGQAPINVITDLGQLILRASQAGNIITEQNFGFITERTRKNQGSTRFINPGGATVAFDLNWFFFFDISTNLSHGNVYPVVEGEALEWVLPPVAAAVIEAGSTWEVHRLVADRGAALYLPRWRGRGIDIDDIRTTLEGRTASIMIQASDDADPTRISIFDAGEHRMIFLPWDGFLAFTNAMNEYDQNECEEAIYDLFADNPDSVIKCFGTDKVYVETIGGTGRMQMSQCIVDGVPRRLKVMASGVSEASIAAEISKAARTGLQPYEVSALIGQSWTMAPTLPGPTEAALLPVQPGTQIPINPEGEFSALANAFRR